MTFPSAGHPDTPFPAHEGFVPLQVLPCGWCWCQDAECWWGKTRISPLVGLGELLGMATAHRDLGMDLGLFKPQKPESKQG